MSSGGVEGEGPSNKKVSLSILSMGIGGDEPVESGGVR